uniref:S1 motif domain-containing protein n=1 Tax=Trieres chinensis TaxID=1514140 RepID=A0A7S1ZHK5_TRICV|mmetsp:Transcript_25465/g.52084  ORF Transcript_25465/g.52084 Transcript_25465/m.52084 type:complete len:232 (+) Transcript_25465:244-939(+)
MPPSAPKLRYDPGTPVAPGDRIGGARRVASGPGTYVRGGNVYASSAGRLKLSSPGADGSSASSNPTVSVELFGNKRRASSQVLSVGTIVLGRIARIETRAAYVEIVASAGFEGDPGGALRESHSGMIRREDVRSGVSEEVEMRESFLPGDVVLARIVSLGDARRYGLSTAEGELGVVRAVSASSGQEMRPLNWKEMVCPMTGVKEMRKCARPAAEGGGTTAGPMATPIKKG